MQICSRSAAFATFKVAVHAALGSKAAMPSCSRKACTRPLPLCSASGSSSGQFPVGPTAPERADDVDRAGAALGRVAACWHPCDPHFCVATARPVDDHDGFVGRFIQGDHDFFQDADQALYSACINARRIPDRRLVPGQRQERSAVDQSYAFALAAKDASTRIDGVVQHPNDAVISWHLPADAMAAGLGRNTGKASSASLAHRNTWRARPNSTNLPKINAGECAQDAIAAINKQ
jgi:hypothetical protein